LAPRHWKWRMKAGAWELARRLKREARPRPDVLLVSDFVDLPALFGELPPDWAALPALLYFHENQLTYPVRAFPGDDEQRKSEGAASSLARADHHFGMTNILSCLRAERVVFNSHFHLQDFRAAARELLGILPRPRPRVELEDALAAARVIAPGIDLTEVPLGAGPAEGRPLRVLFPHRPEHDKRPHVFLAAAAEALARGAQLEFVCLGEGTGQAFATLPAENCVQRGRLACRTEYARLVGSCDVVVSTARHEFFGLAVAEALAAGCTPLLPRRQNYPDLIGSATNDGFHHCGLYETDGQLTSALVAAAGEFEPYRVPQHRAAMRALVEEHRVQTVAAALDGLIADMAASPKR
ncbi:MAG: DUF3524 domain-containing protein, partial [Planctomycetota bacterium]|nr:DUF3524 domain-containing protein [Planctomycetota bacterium]